MASRSAPSVKPARAASKKARPASPTAKPNTEQQIRQLLALAAQPDDLPAKAQQQLLRECESTIRQHWDGFVAAGIALNIVSRKRLYRAAGYETFEAYCQARWDIGRARAYQLIGASAVVENVYNCRQIDVLPLNEAQARPLAKLDPEQQVAVWKQAVKTAGKNRITAEHVAQLVKRQADEAVQDGSKFNPSNESIDWAKWSWNPVTGCRHDCPYCYARAMANRFKARYPKGFEPDFREERLAAPQNTKIPKGHEHEPGINKVFVCSMADLFGKWVPPKWIEAVLAAVRDASQWTFIFLTKNPKRLVDIKWPDNAWVGTTVERQSRVAAAVKAFKRIKAPVRFVSCEPLLEPITFPTLSCFDWLIIGAQSNPTGDNQHDSEPVEADNPAEVSRRGVLRRVVHEGQRTLQPDPRWVRSLIEQAWRDDVLVYCKPNLRAGVRDYPAQG